MTSNNLLVFGQGSIEYVLVNLSYKTSTFEPYVFIKSNCEHDY